MALHTPRISRPESGRTPLIQLQQFVRQHRRRDPTIKITRHHLNQSVNKRGQCPQFRHIRRRIERANLNRSTARRWANIPANLVEIHDPARTLQALLKIFDLLPRIQQVWQASGRQAWRAGMSPAKIRLRMRKSWNAGRLEVWNLYFDSLQPWLASGPRL